MNKYVKENLKLMKTHFMNPHGMTINENISTAYDMAIISHKLL